MKKKTADRMPFDKSTSGAHTMELAPKKSLRPKKRPDATIDLTPDAEEGDQMLIRKFRDGGDVRGCKSMQSSGKGFSGTY
jgi:hypothetical protein